MGQTINRTDPDPYALQQLFPIAHVLEYFSQGLAQLTGPCCGPTFNAMWDYYLAYCEVGFMIEALDNGLHRIRRT